MGGAVLAPRGVAAQTAGRSAADEQLARNIFLRGDVAYQEGRYQAAIDLFREAYRISPRPLMLYNIANAEERLGHLGAAIATLTQYQPSAGSEQAVIAARITSLRERLAAQERAERERTEGAERERAERERTERERTERERAERERAERAERERAERERADNDRGRASPVSTPATSASPAPSGLFGPGLGLTLTGAGVFLVGAVFDGLSLSASGAARASCMTVNGTTLCPSSVRDAVDGAQRNALIGDISLGVGGALAAVGVVLLVIDKTRSGHSETPARAQPNVSFVALPVPGGAMGSVGLRF